VYVSVNEKIDKFKSAFSYFTGYLSNNDINIIFRKAFIYKCTNMLPSDIESSFILLDILTKPHGERLEHATICTDPQSVFDQTLNIIDTFVNKETTLNLHNKSLYDKIFINFDPTDFKKRFYLSGDIRNDLSFLMTFL
jgi:hypothetical protein